MQTRRVVLYAVWVLFIVALAVSHTFRWPQAWLQRRAETIVCGNTIVSILYGARMWANDHSNRFPPTLLSMSNELNTPRILLCPGDHVRQHVYDWAAFTDASSSYEILSPDVPDGNTNTPYLRCKLHGHVGYDATVFDGKKRRTKKIF
jgi:hypothetical protein